MMLPVTQQPLMCQDKGEQLGRAFTTGAVRMHRCEGIQLCTAGREEREGSISWPDKKAERRLAVDQEARWKERSGNQTGGSKNSSKCRAFPGKRCFHMLERPPQRGNVETIKDTRGKEDQDKKEMKTEERGVIFLLALKTLPDYILKTCWTKTCKLLTNSMPYLWHLWCCNIK